MSSAGPHIIFINISTIWTLIGIGTMCFVVYAAVTTKREQDAHAENEQNGNERSNSYTFTDTCDESSGINENMQFLIDMNNDSDATEDIELSSDSETSDEEIELSYVNQNKPKLSIDIDGFSHDSYFFCDNAPLLDNIADEKEEKSDTNHSKSQSEQSINTYTMNHGINSPFNNMGSTFDRRKHMWNKKRETNANSPFSVDNMIRYQYPRYV